MANPRKCQHIWEAAETPMDSSRQWYRCTKCNAYGHSKARFSVITSAPRDGRRRVTPYVCSLDGCGKIATKRLPGRGPRCSYIWRCDDHE